MAEEKDSLTTIYEIVVAGIFIASIGGVAGLSLVAWIAS